MAGAEGKSPHPQISRWPMLRVTAAVVAGGVAVAVFATWVLGVVLFGTLPGTLIPGPPNAAAVGQEGWLALVKVALTVAAGIGAAVALVVAYRKQRLAEQHEPRQRQLSSAPRPLRREMSSVGTLTNTGQLQPN